MSRYSQTSGPSPKINMNRRTSVVKSHKTTPISLQKMKPSIVILLQTASSRRTELIHTTRPLPWTKARTTRPCYHGTSDDVTGSPGRMPFEDANKTGGCFIYPLTPLIHEATVGSTYHKMISFQDRNDEKRCKI